MKPSQAIFPFLRLLLKEPKLILSHLLQFTRERTARHAFVKNYKSQGWPFIRINDIAPIDEIISPYTYLDGTSRPIDIALLMALCRERPNCEYLEIGTWRGESVANVAKVAKHCTSLSFSKSQMAEHGASPTTLELHNRYCQNISNVTVVEGDSRDFDFDTLGKKFDVIFIDGDHSYEGVYSDTLNAFQLLKDKNSVVVWHDCGSTYEGFRYEVMKAVTDATPLDLQKHLFRVSNSFCGVYCKSEVQAKELSSPQIPDKLVEMTIKVVDE